jgi:hypothetical protein
VVFSRHLSPHEKDSTYRHTPIVIPEHEENMTIGLLPLPIYVARTPQERVRQTFADPTTTNFILADGASHIVNR